MSRGPGHVQRQLLAASEAEPGRIFTMAELAQLVWPGETIEHKHMSSLSHSLKTLPGTHDVEVVRTRHHSRKYGQGWHYHICIMAKPKPKPRPKPWTIAELQKLLAKS
jgi:hypothetical protein